MTEIERIIKLIDWLIFSKKIKNRRDIAEKMGYTESSLSQILNNKVPISDKFIKKLSIIDYDINTNWLLTGEGEMLKGDDRVIIDDSQEEVFFVPLLPISAQGGSLNNFVISVKDSDCEKVISPIKGADFAMTVSGDSMAPEYPSGSQIVIKRINETIFIDWGKVYVLDTCNGSIIKIVTLSEKEGCVKCISINPDQKRYAPFDVPFCEINGMYRVMLLMSVK